MFFIRATDKDAAPSPDIQASPSSNPFEAIKSEDEEEEGQAMVDSQEEEEDNEEVDEAELEAFLDEQLADLHDRSGLSSENQELDTFVTAPSKSEEALRTCKFHLNGSEHRCKNLYFSASLL